MPTALSQSETTMNGVINEATIVDGDKNNGILSEETQSTGSSPHPKPHPHRRLPKRLPISSAIPLLPSIEQRDAPPSRPPAGVMGTKAQVYVNHFPVKVAPNQMLYQYDAIVERLSFRGPQIWEEAMSRDQRRRFVQKLADNNAIDFIYW